jgi:prephenate dehydrogenase
MKSLGEMELLIIGLGQIGGSIGYDLVGSRSVARVIGYDIDPAVSSQAMQMGAIDLVATDLDTAAASADIVVLSAPIRTNIGLVSRVGPLMTEGALLLDVGGTKVEIAEVAKSVDGHFEYIGGHPIAGSEGAGFDAAELGKFASTTFVLAPLAGTSADSISTARALVNALAARPVVLTAAEHDQMIALTSQLPYALSLALMQLLAKSESSHPEIRDLIGGSFESATRVAASDSELTLDMFLTNRPRLVSALDDLINGLSSIKDLVDSSDESGLIRLVNESRDRRFEF